MRQAEGLGYSQPPLSSFGMRDPEVVWVIYHVTPFSTESQGLKSYRHPGPPLAPYGGVVGLSPAARGLELGYLQKMECECVGTRLRLLGFRSAGSGG